MPTVLSPTQFIGRGSDIEAFSEASLFKGGELGNRVKVGNKVYQLVKFTEGAALDNHLVYWSDKAAYEVTATLANSEKDLAAGVVHIVPTVNDFMFIQVIDAVILDPPGQFAQIDVERQG